MKGNEHYFQGHFETAAHCYSLSAEYLEVVVDRVGEQQCCEDCNDERCFQHYFIACQNTSHSYAMCGNLTKAEEYLSRPHYKFLALISSESAQEFSVPSAHEIWKEKVQAVCERSLDTLVQFLERHNRRMAADSVMMESRRLLGGEL